MKTLGSYGVCVRLCVSLCMWWRGEGVCLCVFEFVRCVRGVSDCGCVHVLVSGVSGCECGYVCVYG